MFLGALWARLFFQSFPHTRGDVPNSGTERSPRSKFSPHTWGCSGRGSGRTARRSVFPTHVGMFRSQIPTIVSSFGFPHTRGDVPMPSTRARSALMFSPHTWGCSASALAYLVPIDVFPTHVGMFRTASASRPQNRRFPHTRGDVPHLELLLEDAVQFSPHTWGCSSRPPRHRGGPVVFPTHVGMFRDARLAVGLTACFPHTRGDVPS